MHSPPRQGLLAGLAFMILTGLCFTALDSIVKLLIRRHYPMIEVLWARYAFSFLPLLALLPRHGLRLLATRRPQLQLGRACLMLISSAGMYAGLRFLPIADCYAVGFVTPLMVALASAPLLGERVSRRQWLAILGGLAGVLVVIRPGLGALSWAALFPLTTAAANAGYQLMTRVMRATESAATTMVYTFLLGTVLTSALLPIGWVSPDASGWALMAVAGLIGFAGQLSLFQAFRLAPAALVSPISYLQIVWAVAVGLLMFGDPPDPVTLAGAAIVIASGLVVVRRPAVAVGR
jgi:drug/metabolite transporter (DMT)-like permease